MTEISWHDYFVQQARICHEHGSPLYAELLPYLADDYARGGPMADLLADWTENPFLSGVVLRVLGAVHYLVLDGQLPALAGHYPSAGGAPRFPAAAEAFLEAIAAHPERMRASLGETVQTNEVRRSGALLGGFLEVSSETRLPLRLLEIGTSAGLNQVWDRHRYQLGPHRWGDPDAALLIEGEWSGAPLLANVRPEVRSRAGCDLAPIDLREDGALRRLESFVWPDQLERLSNLRLAARTLLAEDVRIEQRGAADWMEDQLTHHVAGVATVLFHSVMWWYVAPDEQQRLTNAVLSAGQATTPSSPLAWLRMESVSADRCEIRLRVWPGGEDRLLGTCGHHGQKIEWLAQSS